MKLPLYTIETPGGILIKSQDTKRRGAKVIGNSKHRTVAYVAVNDQKNRGQARFDALLIVDAVNKAAGIKTHRGLWARLMGR